MENFNKIAECHFISEKITIFNNYQEAVHKRKNSLIEEIHLKTGLIKHL